MTSKLRLKLGPIEIDYEGSEEFMKQELPALIEAVTKLYKASGLPPEALAGNAGAIGSQSTGIQGTTATYAAKLGASTGTELALAAAARLSFGLNTPTFSRAKLLEEMQSATQYYKKSMSGNLTKILATLISTQKLMEPATDTYSLSATTAADLKAKLAS